MYFNSIYWLSRLYRIWITIDNKLFLWNYLKSDENGTNDCEIYTGMKEVIISVSLATPKAEIFADKVQYILVVASPVEVVLLAISIPTTATTSTSEQKESDYCQQLKVCWCLPSNTAVDLTCLAMCLNYGSSFPRPCLSRRIILPCSRSSGRRLVEFSWREMMATCMKWNILIVKSRGPHCSASIQTSLLR